MCGIAGVLARPETSIPERQLQAMRDALLHRGPDGNAIERQGANAFVHTRLSIIDLEGGRQPLEDASGAKLIGNGEIYNYVELWPRFHNRGLRTHSDFEPALHLISDFGPDGLRSLRGMYTLAYCAAGDRDTLLARDPFGIKPLYYAQTPVGIAFASEPKALFAAGFVNPVVDPEKRDELIDIHFTRGRETIFKGVTRVLPGETLTVRDGEITGREQEPAMPASPACDDDEDTLIDAFDKVFEDSIDVHRRSDVPYGLFLSSGIDSSAILAALARLWKDPVVCFTAGFDEGGKDEREAAAGIARHYKAEHIAVEFGAADFWQMLPAVALALDDPTADYAALPTFKLAAEARRHVKVVLTGEGSDELLGGYGRYRRAMRPWWLGGRLPHQRSVLEELGLARAPVTWPARLPVTDRCGTALQQAQAADVESWLPNDVLLKLDRCLMAHGVEGRTPFLDREMAKFAAALPDRMKVRRGQGKYLLRRWAEQHCPPADANSPKSGFTVPVSKWIARRAGDLARLVSGQLGIAEAFHPSVVRSVFMAADERAAGAAAWSLLFYAVWHSVHICSADADNDIFTLLAAAT